MKKLALLTLLLTMGLSYGQIKKKKTISKKVVPTVSTQGEKVTVIDRSTNSKSEIVAYPSGDAPNIQQEQEDENIIYNAAGIEVKPEFSGGNEKLFSFISKNFQYNDVMIENELKGRTIASFVVEKDGSISDIKVVRGMGFGTENEIIRVLKLMPKWNPGEQNGKKVRCSYMIPIAIYATK